MSERFSYNSDDLKRMPKRPERSNKGTFGSLLVIGGSAGMAGAGYFAAKAAYRTGCGLVRLLTPEENLSVYQSLIPEATVTVYNSASPDPATVKNAVARASAVVIGVGLGCTEQSKAVLRAALEACTVPLVIDADGLNLISADKSLFDLVTPNTVFTPHPAEMSRLTGLPVASVLEDIPSVCEDFAKAHRAICVLKDHETAVSNGSKTMINHSGNSGMATGGSGDVLAGMIGSITAQGALPFDAAALGVFIHGLAGDAAAEELSEYSVTASDIIDFIPRIMKRIP